MRATPQRTLGADAGPVTLRPMRGDRRVARTARDSAGVAAMTRARPAANAAIAVAAFGAFLAFIDSTVVNVAFPSLVAAFPHVGIGGLSWVLNAYNVVFAGLLVLAGRFADLLGRRRLFAWGLVVFTVTSAACAASTSVGMLVAFRVLQGAGAAMLVPASLGIVIHASSAEHRSHALSLWAAAAALAAGLGPPIGGALVDAYNWRLVFVVNVPFGAFAWMMTRRKVVESRAPGRRTMPDVRGAVFLSLALGAVTLGIVQGPTWGWGSAGVIGSFVAAAVCATAVVRSSRRHPSPVLDPALLRIRGFMVSNLVVGLAGVGLYAYLLTHILWLHLVWGYSLLVSGLSVAPGALVTVLTARTFGKLADRYGPRAVVIPGALVWACAFVWYTTRVGIHPDFLGAWLPGQVISGVGVAATLPVATSGGLATVPSGRYSTASAVSTSARQVGGVLGIAVLTIFIAHFTPSSLAGDLRHGWQLAAGSFALAAVVAAFFGHVGTGEGQAMPEEDGPLARATGPTAPATAHAAPTDDSLLQRLAPEVRDELLSAGERVHLAAGETLFHLGDPASSLYVVESGRLEVRLPGGAVRELGGGSVVGELALLTGAARSATVVARRDSVLVTVTRERFELLMLARPDAMSELTRALARMLQDGRPLATAPMPPPKVIAVVAAADDGAPVGRVADALADALAHPLPVPPGDGAGPALRVTRIDRDELPLEEAERSSDRVLVCAERTGAWHDACVRQADRVVLVSSGTGPGGNGAVRPTVPTDVVATGAAAGDLDPVAWHDATGCTRVYAMGDHAAAWEERLLPLADRLAGRSVAVALGAGGARALAGVGVLGALEDAGVRVDRVSGVSVGALVAALYATGAGAEEVEARLFDELVQRHPFSDYRLSFTSLSRGSRLDAMLQRCFGDARIESMARELVVCSTDLADGTTVFHRRGLTARAVGASLAMPLLFAPRRVDGCLHVDGSLSASSPADAFAALPEGPVVVVRTARPALRTSEGRVPSIGETLVQVMSFGDRGGEELDGVPSVTVTPRTDDIGTLEFHQMDAAIRAGRLAGGAALTALAGLAGAGLAGAGLAGAGLAGLAGTGLAGLAGAGLAEPGRPGATGRRAPGRRSSPSSSTS